MLEGYRTFENTFHPVLGVRGAASARRSRSPQKPFAALVTPWAAT